MNSRPFFGTSSCAAARCHGGLHDPDRPAWNSAYTVWRNQDPHAQAYADLLSPRGQEMARLYFADEGQTRPEQDQRCLPCHGTPFTLRSVAINEGVGCESCHGYADTWRDEHYLSSWTRNSPGFHDLRTPSARAKACVNCHVGASGRKVNHDLIAAGHPPLRFEMGAFHEQLPKHWDFDREKAEDPQIEARLWLAGQIESGRAALNLMNNRHVEPEFAEYDCESCHHPLSTPGWRTHRGLPLWGTWQFSPRMVDAAFGTIDDGAQVQSPLAGLRQMQSSLAPDRAKMQPLVDELLTRWPKSEAADKPSTPNWHAALELLSQPTTTAADQTWSAAAQRWLAELALDPSDQAERKEILRNIRSQLADPARFNPALLESLEKK